MKRAEIVQLTQGIYAQPQFAHFTVKAETLAAYEAELSDLPMPVEVAQAAVRSLLLEDDQRLPTPQAIRKRVLREAGLLAPSWTEAKAMVDEYVDAYAAGRELPKLPGPVQAALDAKGGAYAARDADNPTGWFSQLRDAYRECAARHDLFVSEPGGIAAFVAACEFVAAVEARRELLQQARRAAALLTEPFAPVVVPDDTVPDDVLLELIRRAEPLTQLEVVDRRKDLERLFATFRKELRGG